jgi:hypothetical protein
MNTIIDLKEACETIYRFSDANQVDPLTGIELMVAYFKQLSQHERDSLCLFMDESKKVDK